MSAGLILLLLLTMFPVPVRAAEEPAQSVTGAISGLSYSITWLPEQPSAPAGGTVDVTVTYVFELPETVNVTSSSAANTLYWRVAVGEDPVFNARYWLSDRTYQLEQDEFKDIAEVGKVSLEKRTENTVIYTLTLSCAPGSNELPAITLTSASTEAGLASGKVLGTSQAHTIEVETSVPPATLTLSASPMEPVIGESFTVTALASDKSGGVTFCYNGESQTALVNPQSGQAEVSFTAIAGNNCVEATQTADDGSVIAVESLPIPVTEKKAYQVSFAVDGEVALTVSNAAVLFYAPNIATNSGWYTDAACTEAQRIEFPYTVTSDCTLYAQSAAPRYTLRFHSGAGDAVCTLGPICAEAGATIQLPEDGLPERTGYLFAGWTDGSNRYASGEELPLTADLDLYACWERRPVQLGYPTELPEGVSAICGGKTEAEYGVEQSFTVELQTGYDPAQLVLWANGVALAPIATGQNGVYQYCFTPTTDTEITVSAPSKLRYVVSLPVGEHFTAQFVGEGNEQSRTLEYGQSYQFTVTADSERYALHEVYLNGQRQMPADCYGATVTGEQSIEIRVEAVEFCTITYLVDGKFLSAAQVERDSEIPGIEAASRVGYRFDGWYADADYCQSSLGKAVADGSVYGRYLPVSGEIRYDLNGGESESPEATSKIYGQAATLSGEIPKREGFEFLGWSMERDADAASYAAGAIYSSEIDPTEGYVTLYAVWRMKYYSITLPSGTGYSILASREPVPYGGDYSFTLQLDAGYQQVTPKVWHNDQLLQAENGTYTICNVTADQVVSVQVTADPVYKVEFYTAGELYTIVPVQHGAVVNQPTPPSIVGYRFDGWDYEFSQPITGDTIIQAQLTKIVPQISWPEQEEGWSLTWDGESVDYGGEVEFTITLEAWCEADGLAVGANGIALAPCRIADGQYDFRLSQITADQRITVCGLSRRQITVCYNANTSDLVENLPATEKLNYWREEDSDNSCLTALQPTRGNYSFVGWSTEADAKTAEYQPGSVAMFTADTTLYAIWAEKELSPTSTVLTSNRKEQYEGQTVVLTANTTGSAGSVAFYRGQMLLDTVPIENGQAQLELQLSAYGPERKEETFRARYLGNEIWAASESEPETVQICSGTLAKPVVRITPDAESESGELEAGRTYCFQLQQPVMALDGRTTEDYSIQWLRNGVAMEGATEPSLTVSDALPGDTFCLRLVPCGTMRSGADSAVLQFAAEEWIPFAIQLQSERRDAGYEGIVQGETVQIEVQLSRPVAELTLHIGDWSAQYTDATGTVTALWNTAGVAAGDYALVVTAADARNSSTSTRWLSVRDGDYMLRATETTKVYTSECQGIDWSLTGLDGATEVQASAQESVRVLYYQNGQVVEPVRAGTYDYELFLPEGKYWTSKSVHGIFVIEPRPVRVADLRGQEKVYDGTTQVDLLEIGLENVVDGDSLYAVGVLRTAAAAAGDQALYASDLQLLGGDAANYILQTNDATGQITIRRNRLQGSIVSRIWAYTGQNIRLSQEDVYLIDQFGQRVTNYELEYYYHSGEKLEKVEALNHMGKYTVVAHGNDNYSGGAAASVYVGEENQVLVPLDTSAVSAVARGVSRAQCYGEAQQPECSESQSYWYQNAWQNEAPVSAGRYLLRTAAAQGEFAYGLYTIVKAAPKLSLTACDRVYDSAPWDGDPQGTYNGETLPVGSWFSWDGNYQPPTEAGLHVVTLHVPETENYTASEISAAYTIRKCTLQIFGDGTIAGLASAGVTPDSSLRDLQVQPEFETRDGQCIPYGAVANNYEIQYQSTAEELGALRIRNAPQSGTGICIAYYGERFQLLADGGLEEKARWASSDPAVAAVDADSGLVTIVGLGSCEIMLQSGSRSVSLTLEARRREILPQSRTIERYSDGTEPIGSRIQWTAVDTGTEVSEPAGTRTWIKPCEVTVEPVSMQCTYGSGLPQLLQYSNADAISNGKAVCLVESGNALETGNYPILVAGEESPNYRVRYAEGNLRILPKTLTVNGGFLAKTEGRTRLSEQGAYYPEHGAVVDPEAVFQRESYRVYGEANWVLDYRLTGLVPGDSDAVVIELLAERLHGTARMDTPAGTLTPQESSTAIPCGNYAVYISQGMEQISARPLTLAARNGIDLEVFYLDVLGSSDQLDREALDTLEALLQNNLSDRYADGLASLLGHSIHDLGIHIESAVLSENGTKICIRLALDDPNYWLVEGGTVEIAVVHSKIAVQYGTLGRRSASVTVYNVDADGNWTEPVDVIRDDIRYLIYAYDAEDGGQGYAYYKSRTPLREVQMTKGDGTGVYIADYSLDPLPAGKYVMFAIAANYTIME